jgi:hypothetical protein
MRINPLKRGPLLGDAILNQSLPQPESIDLLEVFARGGETLNAFSWSQQTAHRGVEHVDHRLGCG